MLHKLYCIKNIKLIKNKQFGAITQLAESFLSMCKAKAFMPIAGGKEEGQEKT